MAYRDYYAHPNPRHQPQQPHIFPANTGLFGRNDGYPDSRHRRTHGNRYHDPGERYFGGNPPWEPAGEFGRNEREDVRYGKYSDLMAIAKSERKQLKERLETLLTLKKSFDHKVQEAERLKHQGYHAKAKEYLISADSEWREWERKFR